MSITSRKYISITRKRHFYTLSNMNYVENDSYDCTTKELYMIVEYELWNEKIIFDNEVFLEKSMWWIW